MAMRITALKTAVAEASARGGKLEADGQRQRAEEVYATLLHVLHALFSSSQDQEYGWVRVVPLLSDLKRPLTVDMFASGRLGQLQARVDTLFDLPEITQVASLADMHEAINAAIAIGSPRYNSGDIRGCCTVYWSTGQALLAAQAVRGFPGYARVLGPIRQVHEIEVPLRPLDQAGLDTYAWTLRHAFDAALKVTG